MSPLSIFITIVALLLVFMLVKYLFTEPYTLSGMKDGKTMTTISADSLATNDSGVPSSNFAYSVWFYVNDWNYKYGKPKVIFGRMGGQGTAETEVVPGVPGRDPCPLVTLGAVENNIAIALSCFPGVDQGSSVEGDRSIIHTCAITNVPIQRWVNLVISVYGRTLDVYMDGKLVRTCLLPGIANVNNNADLYITPAGGFEGWTSNLQYYPEALNPQQVWNIYSKGYGGGLFSNLMSSYDIQISLIQDGTVQSTTTI
jgi:hypothetical protein